jgi:hypothetical protein
MAQFAINPSPFQCRWIAAASEMRLEQWTYAVCLRCRDRPRVVSEDECGRCACWESPTPDARDVDNRIEAALNLDRAQFKRSIDG